MDPSAAPGGIDGMFGGGTRRDLGVEQRADLVVLFDGQIDGFERDRDDRTPFVFLALGADFPVGIPGRFGAAGIVMPAEAVERELVVAVLRIGDKDLAVVAAGERVVFQVFLSERFARNGAAVGDEERIAVVICF